MPSITINGVGFATTIEQDEGESIAAALAKAGIDVSDVDVQVNGAEGTLDQTANDGDEVAATPREAKLG
jgi:hypothetical protein